MPERNITFEIIEHIGVISTYDNGWCKELNVVSWNGGKAKYDLRDWAEDHERMSRGVTFHPDEMRRMVNLYLQNNSRKAVEEGRERQEQRRIRREGYLRDAGSGSANEPAEEEPSQVSLPEDGEDIFSGEEACCGEEPSGPQPLQTGEGDEEPDTDADADTEDSPFDEVKDGREEF